MEILGRANNLKIIFNNKTIKMTDDKLNQIFLNLIFYVKEYLNNLK